MAAESSVATTAGAETESQAQKLLAKHTADEAHEVTIEDAVDEEDVSHPGASSDPNTMSDVAKGKQKADDSTPAPSKPRGPAFDVTSQEAFPSLGGSKAAAPPSWGKKPTNGTANGISNGTPRGPTSNGPPRIQPGSGRGLNMPGQNTESMHVPNNFLLPRQQLKKPIPEIIRDVNRTSKANVTMKDSNTGKIFEAQGPHGSPQQALREIMSKIGAKQTIKINVPNSVRPHIIGRQGATIQDISKRTGARIQMPKQDEIAGLGDDDEIQVSVEGDYFNTGFARKEIEKIVGERTANANMRLNNIPAEFYPFIAGPNNSRLARYEQNNVKVNVPHYHTWRDAAPPSGISKGQPVPFAPQQSLPISISGEREAAMQARAEIENLVKQLERGLSIEETTGIDRARHQFLVGDRGMSAHDFLAETGCALIKPPPGADDDTIFIVGPPEKLEGGLEKVMELMTKVQQLPADIGRPHKAARGGGEQHARNVNKYLQQRKAVEEFERAHGVSLSLPTADDSSTSWQICGPDMRAAMQAQKEILSMVGAHPPSRFRSSRVDPFFHQTLRQREAPRLRREHGVHIVFPDGHTESPDLLLVYEAPGSPSEYVLPRQAVTEAQVKEHERAIKQAMQEIDALIAAQQAIESRQLEAHPKFHDKIRRYVDKEQQGIPQDQFPVQLMFGPAGRQAAQQTPKNNFSIRGPTSSVDALQQQLLAFIEQEIKDEAERGFKLQFDYPQKFANHLIGKRGENINRLREEFDVDIQAKDGKVELTGPEKKCAACKSHILSNLKKLEDEATHTLKIKPQYHRDLIGSKGSQVNRLQERYGVRVNFPRNTPADDAASELGSVKNHRQQNADEVIIKGPKKGADEARDELLNLLQYVMDNSHVVSLSVQQSQIPQLIGAGGREMDKLRLETGCQIDIPNAKEGADEKGRVEVKIRGTKTGVEAAKKILAERIKTLDETVTRHVDVDRRHHKALIGGSGANIRKIVVEAGGPDDSRSVARIVRFPNQGEAEGKIRIEGNKEMVEKIVAALESHAKQKDDQVTDHVEVAPEKHRLLIGRGGETRRSLESKFSVRIDIPRQGSEDKKVTIAGLPADVEKAKAHIEELTKDTPGVTVDVPRKYHHAISDQGRVFRRLRDDHGVTIDHAGQQPPPRPAKTAAGNRGRNVNGGAAMPLITDDATSSASAHSWEIVDNTSSYPGDDGDTTIPWILKGSKPEGIEKAKVHIEAALAKAGKPSWTGYLILPDSRVFGRIIGPGGSQINSIKKSTGCDVQVPRGNAGGEAVTITGEQDKVEEAKDIILGIVKEGAGGRGGPRRGGYRDEEY